MTYFFFLFSSSDIQFMAASKNNVDYLLLHAALESDAASV